MPTGVNGFKAFGVKDLNYKMVFLASSVQTAGTRFSLHGGEENDNVLLLRYSAGSESV